MALISWSDEFSIHIKEIDDQHRQLLELLNVLFEAMKQGKGRDILGDILNKLVDYTAYHFSTEERLFKQYGYPDAEQHKNEHDAFIVQVLTFQESYNKGHSLVTKEVLLFLTDWLKGHILQVDKKFGPFLIGKGIS